MRFSKRMRQRPPVTKKRQRGSLAAVTVLMLLAGLALPATPAAAQGDGYWRVTGEDSFTWPKRSFTSKAPHQANFSNRVDGGWQTEYPNGSLIYENHEDFVVGEFDWTGIEEYVVHAVLHEFIETANPEIDPRNWSYSLGAHPSITYRQQQPLKAPGCDHAEFDFEAEQTTIHVEHMQDGKMWQGRVTIMRWLIDDEFTCHDDNNSGGQGDSQGSDDSSGIDVHGHCGACQIPQGETEPDAPGEPEGGHLIA